MDKQGVKPNELAENRRHSRPEARQEPSGKPFSRRALIASIGLAGAAVVSGGLVQTLQASGNPNDPLGDLHDLETADKSNFVSAINENVRRLAQKVTYAASIAEMKALEALKENDVVVTLGYYNRNDGGQGTYVIRNDSNLVDNGGLCHQLNNGLKAVLVIENGQVNFRQFGAKSLQDNQNVKYDNKPHMMRFLNSWGKSVTNDPTITLLIPQGIWCFSDTHIFRRNGIHITGYNGFVATKANKTVIAPMQNNQQYVWKLGGLADFSDPFAQGAAENSYDKYHMTDIGLDNLTFTSFNGDISDNARSFREIYSVQRAVLFLDWVAFGVFRNINFLFIDGTGLALKSCWELYFPLMNFRWILDYSKPCLLFEEHYNYSDSNFSALSFGELMFEVCNGDYIESRSSRFTHTYFGNINAECSPYNLFKDTGTVRAATFEEADQDWQYRCIFRGSITDNVVFDTINLQHFNHQLHTMANGSKHIVGIVFASNTIFKNVVVNNILLDGTPKKDTAIVETSYNQRNSLTINNISCKTETLLIRPLFKWYGSDLLVNNIHFGSLQNKSVAHHNSYHTLFAADLNYINGRLHYASDSLSKQTVVLRRKIGNHNGNAIGRMLNMLPYPQTYYARIKMDNGAAYRLILTFILNGTNQNRTVEGVGTGTWQTVSVTIPAADVGTLIGIQDESVQEGLLLDCITAGPELA
ncbi:hypothetical protein ACFFNY_02005 [Paenibacillus hodogayensis]|uniref:Right-handed parallel beta-helix repeat-containing protein n=1 Tax=Paenibacillus hodogayensis TaxID=279208 RepID=A0ABV5VPY1_9BACL